MIWTLVAATGLYFRGMWKLTTVERMWNDKTVSELDTYSRKSNLQFVFMNVQLFCLFFLSGLIMNSAVSFSTILSVM